jgi:hypothetical protein
MRSIIGLMLLCALGCGGGLAHIGEEPSGAVKARAKQLSSSYSREVAAIDRLDVAAAKQDESLTILRENTTALAAIKSQVESLASETREATDTLKASLSSSDLNRKDGDPAAREPQEPAQANQSQPAIPVASAPAVRSSGPLKLSWNVEGNWNPSILETAKHLREDHGIIADGMSHQQMHDLHAAVHEGRQVAMKQQPVQLINRGSSCPGGVCPTVRTRRRR